MAGRTGAKETGLSKGKSAKRRSGSIREKRGSRARVPESRHCTMIKPRKRRSGKVREGGRWRESTHLHHLRVELRVEVAEDRGLVEDGALRVVVLVVPVQGLGNIARTMHCRQCALHARALSTQCSEDLGTVCVALR